MQIAGSQFGAAAVGTVRRVGDPSLDGEDFVTVRVKVNGVVDELRFSPGELARGRRGRAPTEAPTSAPTPAAASAPSAPPVPARQRRRAPRRTDAPGRTAVPPQSAAPAAAATTPPRPASPRRSSRRAPAAAPVSIVLSSHGASWSVGAQRGSRSVLRSAAVDPGIVSAIAGLLGQPAVQEAVAAVNDTALAEAELRAEQLRDELARVQAVLDSHRLP